MKVPRTSGKLPWWGPRCNPIVMQKYLICAL